MQELGIQESCLGISPSEVDITKAIVSQGIVVRGCSDEVGIRSIQVHRCPQTSLPKRRAWMTEAPALPNFNSYLVL